MRPIERTAFTLDEAAVSSAIGREQLEEWIYSGELPAFKVGKGRGIVTERRKYERYSDFQESGIRKHESHH